MEKVRESEKKKCIWPGEAKTELAHLSPRKRLRCNKWREFFRLAFFRLWMKNLKKLSLSPKKARTKFYNTGPRKMHSISYAGVISAFLSFFTFKNGFYNFYAPRGNLLLSLEDWVKVTLNCTSGVHFENFRNKILDWESLNVRRS